MKHYIRAFAIGLFAASVSLLIIYYMSDGKANSAKSMTRDEMSDRLKEQGYRIVTESEYITLKVQKDEAQKAQHAASAPNEKDQQKKTDEKANENKANTDKKDKTDKPEKEEQQVKTFTLHIASGMATSEISEMLEDNGIIKDANAFDKYLEKQNYAKYIQLGKHKVSSDMSQEEMAKALTK